MRVKKKAGPAGPQRILAMCRISFRAVYACGEALLPLGDATGGHGLPPGVIPGLLGELPPPLLLWPLALPEVDGLEPDAPEFGDVLEDPFVLPGNVPQGEPLGEPPGLLGVLGLMVDGWVVLPGVGVAGEFEPGTVVFGVPLGDVDPGVVCGVPAGGVAVPAGGVAVLAGGVAVPAGGVAGDPGVDVCPADEPPAGRAPPEGAACATAQLAQHNTTESNASLDVDI